MYRLLIIDGDTSSCECFQSLIDWSYYHITNIMAVTSYAEALITAIDFKPHIAFVDVNLGEHNGYDLIEQLRAIGLNIIYCMISEHDDFYSIQKSLQINASDYLLKPLDPTELTASLERMIVQDLHGTLPCTPILNDKRLDPVLKKDYAHFSKITQKLLLFVKDNYQSSLSLTSIGDSLHMSNKYMGRIFIQDTGMKFSEYLTAYRMIRARFLIENTNDKISTIACMVGYSQLNNFYVHFKNYYHISPNTIRSKAD